MKSHRVKFPAFFSTPTSFRRERKRRESNPQTVQVHRHRFSGPVGIATFHPFPRSAEDAGLEPATDDSTPAPRFQRGPSSGRIPSVHRTADGGSRTRNDPILSRTPLPVGIRRRCHVSARIRTGTARRLSLLKTACLPSSTTETVLIHPFTKAEAEGVEPPRPVKARPVSSRLQSPICLRFRQCHGPGSNRRPSGLQPDALPVELPRQQYRRRESNPHALPGGTF